MIAHFLICGAQRSGTTFLAELMDQHPEIELLRPLRPEPKFFLRSDAAAETYRQMFARAGGARVLGEKSTSYMERPDAGVRARAQLQDVRAIFVLRDPLDRAFSNYCFSVQNGVETLPFDEALRREPERLGLRPGNASVSPFSYLRRGIYSEYLVAWESVVGRNGMYLLAFEDLIRDPGAVRQLFAWLGVSADFEPDRRRASQNASALLDGGGPAVARQYAELFRDSNRVLVERYGFDVSRWKSAR